MFFPFYRITSGAVSHNSPLTSKLAYSVTCLTSPLVWLMAIRILCRSQNKLMRIEEMFQQVRVLAAPPEDQGSIPSTHAVAHDHLYDSSSSGSDGSFQASSPVYTWCADIQTKNKTKQNLKK